MADLIVKRGMGRRDLLRRYVIMIDGERVGHIRAGATTHVTVAEGMRHVSLCIDGYGSPERTLLASNSAVAIFWCAPGAFVPAGKRFEAPWFSPARFLPEDRTTYLSLEAERAEDVARAFVQAAWTAAQSQFRARAQPGEPSRYGLTMSDLEVLHHGTHSPDTIMVTAPGSANHRLWTELARTGWMIDATIPELHTKYGGVAFKVTDHGRIELMNIFQDGTSSLPVARPRTANPKT